MAREMKDSGVPWLGLIPSDWEVSFLKYAVRWKSETGFPDETVLSLYRNYGVLPKDSRDDNHNVTSLDTSGYKLVDIGDLVINKMKAWQGSMAVSDFRGIVSPAYHVCRITNERINGRYLHYLLRNPAYLPEYARLSTGLRIGQWDLSFDDFKNIPFLIPPIKEQEQIAAYIEIKCAAIDTIIGKTRLSIEEYKKLKQAIITQAVTKGIRGDRPMKDSGVEWIGETPSEWDIKLAFQLFHQVKNKNEGLAEKNLLSLSYGKIKRKSMDTIGGLLPESFDGYNIIEANDIILRLTDLQNDHTSLRVGLSNERGIVTSAYLALRNQSENMSLYLYYYLHSFDVYKGFYGMGGGVRQGLNWDGLKLLKIILPSVGEQKEIATYLDKKCAEIDALIEQKSKFLSELEAYKKSLIFEYVTGKKEVVVEQAQEIVIYPYFPATIRARSSRFAQAILMSKVLDECRIKTGRVKLEKIMYILENSIGFDFGTEYVREAAGPLDASIYECESIISKRNKWFTISSSKYGVSYKPAKDLDNYKKYYTQYFSDYENSIDRIIDILKDYSLEQAEVIATLYGVWNDFIIDKRSYSDEDIVDEVLNNWNDSKKRFPKDMWLRAIQKMREIDLVPHGYGRHTVIKKGK